MIRSFSTCTTCQRTWQKKQAQRKRNRIQHSQFAKVVTFLKLSILWDKMRVENRTCLSKRWSPVKKTCTNHLKDSLSHTQCIVSLLQLPRLWLFLHIFRAILQQFDGRRELFSLHQALRQGVNCSMMLWH